MQLSIILLVSTARLLEFHFTRNFRKKIVPDKTNSQIETFDASRASVRAGIIFGVAVALLFGWFSIRWQLGDMLAYYTTPTDDGAKNMARTALDLAPRDPLANWLAVNTENASASKNNIETVVKLAPFDYLWWIQLGREREQAGDVDAAEKAFRRAIELAPAYSLPRWQTGNFYLRQMRADDAFRELTAAAQSNSLYREQVFSIAWEYFEGDTARLEQIAGNSPEMRADLAKYYALKNRSDDSLRVWNTLSENEKRENAAAARAIARALYDKRLFRAALEFVRQLDIEPEAKNETVQNAGFERPIENYKDVYFGWLVFPAERMEIKLDPTQKHEGARSLRVSFNGYAQPAIFNIRQNVTVEPRAHYRLSFWIKTENLKTGGAPVLEIYTTADGKTVASSAPFPVGTNDWQQLKVEFAAPESVEAVGIRTARVYCGENCPLVGVFWYDDFRLEKLK